MNKLLLLFLALTALNSFSAENNKIVKLESPYYTFPRTGNQHVDLSSNWQLTAMDSIIGDISQLDVKDYINVDTPSSVQIAYFRAGKLPEPYAHKNAELYRPLEQKVYYYSKSFLTPKMADDAVAILSFDGVDYTSRVWVNGVLLGEHEGMFGGPSVRIDKLLKQDGQANHVVVEVRSANYCLPEYKSHEPKNFVRSWFFSRSREGVTPFFHLGMWKGARLEVLPYYHIERPFLSTRLIKDGKAVIDFSTEIFSGKNSKDCTLHPWGNGTSGPVVRGGNVVKDDITVIVRLLDAGQVAYEKQFKPVVVEGRCWMEESFEIQNPKLWYPNQMGKPDFYNASVLLLVNGKQVDEVDFDFGVRTIEHVRSAGVRVADRWNNWQYVINGKKLFLKGVNWTPIDALSNLPYENYEWTIRAARDMGVQMFRIWGTGYLETEAFYDLCNKYGIMVWQDFTIANFDTPEWPQDVWEAQVCQNIFRLRNQPSLAVWCGGNEFNPYSLGNTLSVGILERNLKEFDPTRPFWRTSPDGGSDHIYTDFDPNNYKSFNLLPYISETGIHCMPSAKNARTIINSEDFNGMGNITDESFRRTNPEFVYHFAEYFPWRVPRMISRASHIDNMSDPLYEDMVEATQIGAGEFYQIMSEGVQSNYPVTVGLMPWVFRRPWPVVAAIQLMDAFGQPTAPYYFLKRSYENTHVMIDLPKLLFAPKDTIALKTCVLNAVGCTDFVGTLSVVIMDNNFHEMLNASAEVKVDSGPSVSKASLGSFIIPEDYHNKYFFIMTKLKNSKGEEISRSFYWPRTIAQMEDEEYHANYLIKKPEWPTLKNGPWLKPTIAAHKTTITISKPEMIGKGCYKIKVSNKGKYISPMTIIDTDKGIFYCSDNYFSLEPGETREIIVNTRSNSFPTMIIVSSWNAKSQSAKI